MAVFIIFKHTTLCFVILLKVCRPQQYFMFLVQYKDIHIIILFFTLDYRHNGRDLQSSTLSVPEQVMSSNHCSPSGSPHRVDVIGRTRSWSPSAPPPQRYDNFVCSMILRVNLT